MSPALNWADIWLLQAIHACRKGDQSPSIDEVIGAADFINHAIMTFEEFSGGLRRLERAGLLQRVDQVMKLSDKAIELFQNLESHGIHKQSELLRHELSVKAWSKDYRPRDQLADPDSSISRERYDAAVMKYTRRSPL